MQIRDHVFLVTGAASGLGAATARMVVNEGGRVVAADVNRAGGEALAGELGGAARFVATDVTSEADAQAAVELGAHTLWPFARAGQLRRHCARGENRGPRGSASAGHLRQGGEHQPGRDFQHDAARGGAIAREDAGEDGERGVIVNTASVAAFEGQIGQAAYAASKGGVAALTLPAARELARHGIRVVTIAPGVFATPMMAGFTEEVQQGLGKSVPFPQRLGRPEEYAALVKQICENRMLNGETIRLDGALRMTAR